MRYAIAGSSGFLGTALRVRLEEQGHEVVRLVRRPASSPSESGWDPDSGQVDQSVIASTDVVVNLAGAPIAHWPWTKSYKREMLESRVRSTRTVAEAVARSARPPVLVNASGVHRYGEDRGDEWLDEDTGPGTGLLAEVTAAWEAATQPAVEAGARVCLLRTGVVLDRKAAAFRLMRLPFVFGLGGRLGSGRQYLPAISRMDWEDAVLMLASSRRCSGPYNLVGPNPPTNAEFSRVLARAMHRPAVVPVPGWPLKLVLRGLEMQGLGSLRARPRRLLAAGFTFSHPDVESIVAAALDRSR